MGRKMKYDSSQYINNIRYKGNWKVADCSYCYHKGIRSNKWKFHFHENKEQVQANKNNADFCEDVVSFCANLISQHLLNFISQKFPEGISQRFKKDYYDLVEERIMKAVLIDPRQVNHPIFTQQANQIMQSESQKSRDNQVGASSENLHQFAGRGRQMNEDQDNQAHSFNQYVERFIDQQFQLHTYSISDRAKSIKQILEKYKTSQLQVSEVKNIFSFTKAKDNCLYFLLKQCFYCEKQFNLILGQYRQCCYCRSRIHLHCYSKINSCICASSKYTLNHILNMNDFMKQYKEPNDIINTEILTERTPNISRFVPRTQKKKIVAQQEKIQKFLMSKNGLFYINGCLTPSNIQCSGDALDNPFLTIANQRLIKIYQSYRLGRYKAPIRLKQTINGRVGIQAIQQIPKYTFLCQYATDILPAVFIKHANLKETPMLYVNSRNSSKQLVLVPFNCSNWASLIHKDTAGNCSSFRILINGKVRIVVYSTTKIRQSEQLIYYYQSYFNDYHSEAFAQFLD